MSDSFASDEVKNAAQSLQMIEVYVSSYFPFFFFISTFSFFFLLLDFFVHKIIYLYF